MDLTLETIEALCKLVVSNKLDCLEYAGLKITRSKHEVKTDNKVNNSVFNNMTDEELLFYSTSSPLTQEDVAALAINPPKRKLRNSNG